MGIINTIKIHYRGSSLSSLLLFIFIICSIGLSNSSRAQGLPLDRLTVDSLSSKLEIAKNHIDNGYYSYASVEISRQFKKDSTLFLQAATLLGGNYHLVRITDNLYADRVGGFSPSGNKLIYARDTSVIHLDDGLFQSYEDRTTGIVIYDFTTDSETIINLPQENPCKPKFRDENSFYFIADTDSSKGYAFIKGYTSIKSLYCYEMEPDSAFKCCELSGNVYCPSGDGIIIYDRGKSLLEYFRPDNLERDVLFDNESLLTLKRPIPLIQNISVGRDVIMFEAGFQVGSVNKNIYSLPLTGGTPQVVTRDMKRFMSFGAYYPAAVDSNEFAYLVGDDSNSNIFYMKDGIKYRLTFEPGYKYYLVISPDGTKLAYSYMIEREGMESFEIFMLDFTQNATIEDLNYRLKAISHWYD